jgi:UPF0755 protein
MSEREALPDEAGAEDDYEYEYVPGGKRRKGRGAKGCLAVVVALAILAGGFYFALTKGVSFVADQFQGPDDYPGPGTGQVEFTVNEGDTIAQMGRNLKDQGVTKSVQAFIDAANGEPDSSGIQVGAYELQEEMKASDALDVLIDPANLVSYPTVTIQEGLQVTEIVAKLADATDFSEAQFDKALQQPAKIGLPDYADGNAEGYLFPATYEIKPGMKPVAILKAMVTRWQEAADAAGLEEKAAALGKTPAELMIIASLIQAEGRGDDMPKISRVIYNRLDGPGDKGGTNGYLGIDASNAYGLGLSGTTALSSEQLAEPTPYNTRQTGGQPGLPPTPIEAPGDDAIAAAANPAEGPWYYYVTVNLETGETKFYEDYNDFLGGKAEYEAYCATVDRC